MRKRACPGMCWEGRLVNCIALLLSPCPGPVGVDPQALISQFFPDSFFFFWVTVWTVAVPVYRFRWRSSIDGLNVRRKNEGKILAYPELSADLAASFQNYE